MEPAGFRKELIAWGKANFQPLPWRLTSDPYQILIAEVMLHRTQSRQVVVPFKNFISHYPNVRTLAGSKSEELEANFYSLGLRWRTKLIRQLAIEIVTRFNGKIPQSKEELMSLPGISDYIASAVRCFAWNLPEALVDTNTVRVVGRLFALEIKDSSRRNRNFCKLISELVDPLEPRAYNYALLDLAHSICTKRQSPLHSICPVSRFCLSIYPELIEEEHSEPLIQSQA